jgi:hypothetical protein
MYNCFNHHSLFVGPNVTEEAEYPIVCDDFSITSFTEDKGSPIDSLSEESFASKPIPKPSGSLKMKKRGKNEEEPCIISSTPEAESYFQQQAEILYEKAASGFLDIDVVPERRKTSDVLTVKTSAPEAHFDVADLSAEPSLAVKPLRTTKGVPLSSFEALYDRTQVEDVPGDLTLGAGELFPGDKFHGTRQEFEPGTSSFENIYHEPLYVGIQSDHMLPDVRWSAPADTIEPPVILKEEFDQRYGAVQERIEEHFSEISELVSKQG